VFLMIGLGRILRSHGLINSDRARFMNYLVYYLSLPALIFAEVAKQPIDTFLNAALIAVPLAAILPVALVYAGIARARHYSGTFAAVFIFSTYWANTAYMGFPLTMSAFGEEGLALAAIYNAIAMPVFVVSGCLLIALYGQESSSPWQRIADLVRNPIIIAAVSGVVVAALAHPLRGADGTLSLPEGGRALLAMIGGFLKLIGGVGLPLALLAIGSSLKMGHLRGHWDAVAFTVVGRLVLTPLTTLVLMWLIFPTVDLVVKGVVVLMTSLPLAVASYVIASDAHGGEEFSTSVLVISTLFSTITVPAWLYFVL
jgi:hypothetical protein